MAAALTAFIFPHVATAGAPFVTDDPDPVDLGHGEAYFFAQSVHLHGETSGVAPAVDFNYGAFQGVHLHLLAPLAFIDASGDSARSGLGDIELGAKIRFVGAEDNCLGIKTAVFPQINLPTGDSDKDLGAGFLRGYIPLWLGKDFGDWTTYGGGGYWINPGSANRNSWFFGWELQRKMTERLVLGSELYYTSTDENGGLDSAGFNVGTIVDLTEAHHLAFSAGRGLLHAKDTNEFSFYAAYQLTF
jgi:hypothetical protein